MHAIRLAGWIRRRSPGHRGRTGRARPATGRRPVSTASDPSARRRADAPCGWSRWFSGAWACSRWLASWPLQPYIDATWRAEADGTVELLHSPLPALQQLSGKRLERIAGGEGGSLDADAALLQRAARWSVDDTLRQRQLQAQQQLAAMLGQGALSLQFAAGRQVLLEPAPRGLGGLGALFWLLGAAPWRWAWSLPPC